MRMVNGGNVSVAWTGRTAPADRARRRRRGGGGRGAPAAPARRRDRPGAGERRDRTSAGTRSTARATSARPQLALFAGQARGRARRARLARAPPARRLRGPFRRPLARRRGGRRRALRRAHRRAAARWRRSRASARSTSACDAVLGRVGRRPRQVRRRSARSSRGAGAALLLALMRRFPRALVAARRRGGGRGRRGLPVRRPGRARPDLQPLHAAAAGPDPQRRARAGPPGGGEGRPGLRGRRLPPHDGGQRLRHRPRRAPSASSSTTRCSSASRATRRDLVVAHELGHVHYRDVPRGLLYLALVAPAALFAAARLTERWRPPETRPGAPAMLPAAALALGIVAFGTSHDRQPALARASSSARTRSR